MLFLPLENTNVNGSCVIHNYVSCLFFSHWLFIHHYPSVWDSILSSGHSANICWVEFWERLNDMMYAKCLGRGNSTSKCYWMLTIILKITQLTSDEILLAFSWDICGLWREKCFKEIQIWTLFNEKKLKNHFIFLNIDLLIGKTNNLLIDWEWLFLATNQS